MTAVAFKEGAEQCLALENESDAKELRSGQSHFTASSFPFRRSLLFVISGHSPISLPLWSQRSQLKILTVIGSHS